MMRSQPLQRAACVLGALGTVALLAAGVAHTQAQARARSLLQLAAVPAQRELENFEVSLDGKIIAREPNGDVIQMDVPGWQVWTSSPHPPPSPLSKRRPLPLAAVPRAQQAA